MGQDLIGGGQGLFGLCRRFGVPWWGALAIFGPDPAIGPAFLAGV